MRWTANPMFAVLEDAEAGVVRKPKKRTFFKHLLGCGYGDEGRILPPEKRDGNVKDDVVR